MTEEYNVKGNLTTVIKFAVMTIAPYLGVAEATQNQIIAVIIAVVGLILAYFDAKYDNTLINQPNVKEEDDGEYVLWHTEPVNCRCEISPKTCEEDAINPEYSGDDGGA